MLIKRLYLVVIVVGMMLVMAACDMGTAAQPTAVVGAPTAVLNVPTTTGSTPNQEATMTAGTLVVFRTRGGIAGMDKVLTISDTGETTLTDRGKPVSAGKLDDKQLSDLKAQVEAASKLTLKDRYDNGNVADDIYRKITFTQNGSTKSVTVAEVGSGADVPAELQTLVATLKSLVG